MKNFLSPKRENQSEIEKMRDSFQESANPDQPDINITEGGEFLDDSIRMEDQPLIENREQSAEAS